MVPCGLPAVINVLSQRGKLVTKESVMSGQHYQRPVATSTLGWIASSIYSRTIG